MKYFLEGFQMVFNSADFLGGLGVLTALLVITLLIVISFLAIVVTIISINYWIERIR